jgi:light-regulated signal transduction histidine kinase (bacteriophytochrome)
LIKKIRFVRAYNIIDGLLAYARADNAEIPTETIELNAVLQEVLDNLPVNSKVKVEVEPLPVLQAERLLLFEIFYNLVSNAIKYNDKDNGFVKVYAREEDNQWRFFVEDNGIGIAEIYHKRIFVVFQTLKERDTVESTGVGLAIVKKILDRKKQTIQVSSQPGIGSIFSFTWPKN